MVQPTDERLGDDPDFRARVEQSAQGSIANLDGIIFSQATELLDGIDAARAAGAPRELTSEAIAAEFGLDLDTD